jgi:hypothetical protein
MSVLPYQSHLPHRYKFFYSSFLAFILNKN